MGRIIRLELENFKSFGSHIAIGPFADFTCVVGQNGAGKSNVMDAICFVLGAASQNLRGGKMIDLIHRPDSVSDAVGETNACVTLVYSTDNFETKEFERRILSTSGFVEDYVDGEVVSFEEYKTALRESGMHGHMKNFMIFQNEVERLASKTPKDLSELFEEVSGSGDLKKEYNKALSKMEKCEAEVTFIFQKKKSLNNAKRALRQQKEEAETYMQTKKLLEECDNRRRLFKVFHMEEDFNGKQEMLKSAEQEVASAEEMHRAQLDQLSAYRRDISSLRIEEAKCEQRIRRAKKDQDRLHIRAVEANAEIAKQRSKMDGLRLDHARQELNEQIETIRKLEIMLSDTEDSLAQAKRESDEHSMRRISHADLDEYRRLQELCKTRNCVVQAELNLMNRNASIRKQRLSVLQSNIAEDEKRRAKIADDLEELNKKKQSTLAKLNTAKELVRSLEADLISQESAAKENKRQRAELHTKCENLTSEIHINKYQMEEFNKRNTMVHSLRTLKRLYKGVKGTLGELCRPVNRKYTVPMRVLLGSLLKACVVDTDKTATECIAYLREQRIGTLTFLPLNALRFETIPDHFRRLGGSVALLRDVIAVDDESVWPAVFYAAGSALVCETLSEARELRFGRNPVHAKVCTYDGTVINKKGFITGGTSPANHESRPASDDEKCREREELLKVSLQRMYQLEQDYRSLEGDELINLRNRLHRSKANLASLGLEITRISALIDEGERVRSNVESGISKTRYSLAEGEEYLKQLSADSARLEDELRAVREAVMEDFLQSRNFDNLQTFDEEVIDKERNMSSRIQGLQRQRDRLTAQVEYERSRGLNERLAEIESEHEKLLQSLKHDQESATYLEDEIQQRRCGTAKLEEEDLAWKAKIKQAHEQEKETKRQVRNASDNLSAVQKKLKSVKQDCNTLVSKREEAVRALSGELQTGADQGGEPGVNEFSPGAVDFSSLSRKEKTITGMEERAAWEEEQRKRSLDLEARINALEPNLRAIERMQDLNGRIEATNNELLEARKISVEATRTFERVSRRREELFNSCFRSVARKTSDTYKELTSTPAFPNGGTAYLSLESPDSPFLKGIKYSAMPPSKRFRDMDQLSGGERTMAALALLFAINEYSPTPFLIMDEADAALDNRNVQSMSSFLRSRSTDTQLIVISLKDAFFKRADVLVGIYRDRSFTSQSVCLNLSSRFPASEEARLSESKTGLL